MQAGVKALDKCNLTWKFMGEGVPKFARNSGSFRAYKKLPHLTNGTPEALQDLDSGHARLQELGKSKQTKPSVLILSSSDHAAFSYGDSVSQSLLRAQD